MRKFRLFTALLVVALCIGFSSCGRNSLVGTTWVGIEDGTWTFVFTTGNTGAFTISFECEEDPESNSFAFTYTFNAPVITIMLTGQVEGVDDASDIRIDSHLLTGEVRGSRMTLRVEENELILVRK